MPYYKVNDVKSKADGKWLDIFDALAPDLRPAIYKKAEKRNGHVVCPVHGSSSKGSQGNFRLFDDVDKTGGVTCNQCGSKTDGFKTLMWMFNYDFKTALHSVGDYLMAGTSEYRSIVKQANKKLEQSRIKREEYSDRLKKQIDTFWNKEVITVDAVAATPMVNYLFNRGIDEELLNSSTMDSICFHDRVAYYDESEKYVGHFPAIILKISAPDNSMVTVHRVYITETGYKAKVDSPKKMKSVPIDRTCSGASIKIGEPRNGVLGIAEGFETAMAVTSATGMTCWSSVNATLLESFVPPSDVKVVVIWADKDRSFRGAESAQILKAALLQRGIECLIAYPKGDIPAGEKSLDWNDVWLTDRSTGFPDVTHLC